MNVPSKAMWRRKMFLINLNENFVAVLLRMAINVNTFLRKKLNKFCWNFSRTKVVRQDNKMETSNILHFFSLKLAYNKPIIQFAKSEPTKMLFYNSRTICFYNIYFFEFFFNQVKIIIYSGPKKLCILYLSVKKETAWQMILV
jgi:hypothetical protein